MFFSFDSNVFCRGKKLGVPFKQSKHPLQALYNSRPSQLSLLTNCLRCLFQSSNLSARADVLWIQRPLEIGQKISKAFPRNCLHIITVAWTTEPKQFQFGFFSSEHKENALSVVGDLLSSRHAGNSNTSLFNRGSIRNIRTKNKGTRSQREFLFKSSYSARFSQTAYIWKEHRSVHKMAFNFVK